MAHTCIIQYKIKYGYTIIVTYTVGRLFFEGRKFREFALKSFRVFNFREFMPSAILYRKNLIFAEVIFANLQEIAKFAKFIALEKKAPYGTIHNNYNTITNNYN